MKKIVTITRVKNEGDIIESFCRYNLTYCDALLIVDNGSLDRSVEIVKALINEGLPIILKEDHTKDYNGPLVNAMMETAFYELDADLVIPLDADEFLCRVDGGNPRDTLEELEENVEYQVLWRTYVYQEEPKELNSFLPSSFIFYRNPILEEVQGHAGTVLASRFLAEEKQAQIVGGAHWLVYPDKYKEAVNVQTHKDLVCAHYPIRSQHQIQLKTIITWLGRWNTYFPAPRNLTDIHQSGICFNEIRDKGEISSENMKMFSIGYSMVNVVNRLDFERLHELLDSLGDSVLVEGKMDTDFCTDKVILKYIDSSYDSVSIQKAILTKLDETITFLSSINTDRLNEIQQLQSSIHQLQSYNQQLQSSNQQLLSSNQQLKTNNQDLQLNNQKLQYDIRELSSNIEFLNDTLTLQIQSLSNELNEIKSSRGYKMLLRYYLFRSRFKKR